MSRKFWVSKMTTRLNEAYFNWLVSQIEIPNGKSYTYLFERMHSLEFVWTVPHDDNRIQDALDLRVEFKYESNLRGEIKTPVSILEVLIALSRRVAFIGGGWEYAWA